MNSIIPSNWYYIRNPFDNISKNSYKRMVLLSRDTHDKLLRRSSDPAILALYNMYLPLLMVVNMQNEQGRYKASVEVPPSE